MRVSKTLFPVGRKHLGGLLLLALLSLACVAFTMTGGEDDLYAARKEILVRRLAHELLLQSGDSTSRVLPVKKISANEYRVGFERAFSFQPEALVATTRRLFADHTPATDYVVNVLNCADSSVAYGFAVSENRKNEIIACLGRKQPEACYQVSVRFGGAGSNPLKNRYLLAGFALLAIAGYALFLLPAKRPPQQAQDGARAGAADTTPSLGAPGNLFTLGSAIFDADARTLQLGDTSSDLTKTETRLLRIFASAPNEVIERARLQKEIWEDEGVIVGRSLDMFISKLRKKLEAEPNVKIAVVRGKGYRLEVI